MLQEKFRLISNIEKPSDIYKKKVVDYILRNELSLDEAEGELCFSKNSLSRWVRRYSKNMKMYKHPHKGVQKYFYS